MKLAEEVLAFILFFLLEYRKKNLFMMWVSWKLVEEDDEKGACALFRDLIFLLGTKALNVDLDAMVWLSSQALDLHLNTRAFATPRNFHNSFIYLFINININGKYIYINRWGLFPKYFITRVWSILQCVMAN